MKVLQRSHIEARFLTLNHPIKDGKDKEEESSKLLQPNEKTVSKELFS